MTKNNNHQTFRDFFIKKIIVIGDLRPKFKLHLI